MEYEITDLVSKHTFSTTNYHLALHEYLSLIHHMLCILVSNKITISINSIHTDNYSFIIKAKNHKGNKIYPYVTDRYTIDLSNMVLKSSSGNKVVIPDVAPFDELKRIIMHNLKSLAINEPRFIKLIDEAELKKTVDDVINMQKINSDTEQINNINKPIVSISNNIIAHSATKKSTGITTTLPSTQELANLIRLKEAKTEELDDVKQQHDSKLEKYSEITKEKKLTALEKERQEDAYKKFVANKQAYKKMIGAYNNSNKEFNIDAIPDFLIREFDILQTMDEMHILDTDDEYILFKELYNDAYSDLKNTSNSNDIKSAFIPHNINYLPEKEQKQYPSIDSIMEKVDNDNEIIFS